MVIQIPEPQYEKTKQALREFVLGNPDTIEIRNFGGGEYGSSYTFTEAGIEQMMEIVKAGISEHFDEAMAVAEKIVNGEDYLAAYPDGDGL